jgi:hypothetical protein
MELTTQHGPAPKPGDPGVRRYTYRDATVPKQRPEQTSTKPETASDKNARTWHGQEVAKALGIRDEPLDRRSQAVVTEGKTVEADPLVGEAQLSLWAAPRPTDRPGTESGPRPLRREETTKPAEGEDLLDRYRRLTRDQDARTHNAVVHGDWAGQVPTRRDAVVRAEYAAPHPDDFRGGSAHRGRGGELVLDNPVAWDGDDQGDSLSIGLSR